MEPVKLKGTREGIVVHLNCSIEFTELCEKIKAKISSANKFLGKNTKIIINSGETQLEEGQAQSLINLFQSLGLVVKRFIPEVKKKEETKVKMEIPLKVLDSDRYIVEGPVLMIRKNIRSGQRIYHEGTVIIIGDVNPGAEVIATGHILVIGNLRGIAHAGAKGDNSVIVFATKLQPTQLRIANYISRAPDEEEIIPTEPEIARIKNGMVVIEKYSQK